jgi:hypothetical protein
LSKDRSAADGLEMALALEPQGHLVSIPCLINVIDRKLLPPDLRI